MNDIQVTLQAQFAKMRHVKPPVTVGQVVETPPDSGRYKVLVDTIVSESTWERHVNRAGYQYLGSGWADDAYYIKIAERRNHTKENGRRDKPHR